MNWDKNIDKYNCHTGTRLYPFNNRTSTNTDKLKKHVDNRHKNLKTIKEVFEKYNIKWCICSGSLLGPMRSGDLILHDYDDDLWIFNRISNECIVELINNDFKICRTEGDYVISIIRYGAPIDLCFRNEIYPGLYSTLSPRKNVFNESVKFYENMKTINLRGIDYPVPNHTKKYIEFVYSNWKTPNPFGHHRGNNTPRDPYIVFLKEEKDSINLDLYKDMKCSEGQIKYYFI